MKFAGRLIWSIAAAIFAYTGADAAVHQDVTFAGGAGDVVLAGTLTTPDSCSRRTPVVVLVSGSGLQNRDEELFGHKPFAAIADYLADRGIATLRYDDRGFGQSTGEGEAATTTDFARDAQAAVGYLRQLRRFGRVGILGHSEGGSIAIKLAAKAVPDFIVTMGAPAVRGDSILIDQSRTALTAAYLPKEVINNYLEALRYMYANKSTFGPIVAASAVMIDTGLWPDDPVYNQLKSNLISIANSRNAWLEEFISYSPRADIAAVRCPILALYGSLDKQVRPELNAGPMRLGLATARANKEDSHSRVEVLDGFNHLMQKAMTGDINEYSQISEDISPEVLNVIADFILAL